VEKNQLLQFERVGYLLLENFLAAESCDELVAEFASAGRLHDSDPMRPRGGMRNALISSPRARSWARSPGVMAVVRNLVGSNPVPVRAILFDKTASANWRIPWHQDLVIAVDRRIETPGFGPWSVKEGVLQVKPPAEILAQMVTLRLHFDDCDAENGALSVLPGSHRFGELEPEAIRTQVQEIPPVVCAMSKGGALLMRPLLLHSSAPATKPSHRRVLHIEYAAMELPNGLKWVDLQ